MGIELAEILLGEGNDVYNKALGIISRWVLGGVMWVGVFLRIFGVIGDLIVSLGGGGACVG